MKKIFALLFPLMLAACLNPPVVLTDTPVPPTTSTGDAPYLPNSAWQPGAYNPDVTPNTIQTTICVSGYTAKIQIGRAHV